MDENVLVDFALYKGKPASELLKNRGYCEYLMSFPWFKRDQSDLYNAMVERGYEPLGSEAHNLIVGRFLYDDFCLGFLRAANPLWLRLRFAEFKQCREHVRDRYRQRLQKVVADVSAGRLPQEHADAALAKHDAFMEMDRQDQEDGYRVVATPRFECKVSPEAKRVYDVRLDVEVFGWWKRKEIEIARSGATKPEVRIEVKPDLVEEFPHTMRQMTESGAEYLLLGTYRGKSLSVDELRRYFGTAGIKLIFLSEVEALMRRRPTLRLVSSA